MFIRKTTYSLITRKHRRAAASPTIDKRGTVRDLPWFDPRRIIGSEMWDNPSEYETVERDAAQDKVPTPEQRKELRRAILRFARLLPPGAERNQLRWTARSVTFFEEGPTSNPVSEKARSATES